MEPMRGNLSMQPISEDDVEAAIREKGLTAPRITPDDINALFKQVTFDVHRIPGTTTILVTCMLDGFSLATGKSACVDIANFDQTIGVRIARDNASAEARNKLWELEGYALKKKLSHG